MICFLKVPLLAKLHLNKNERFFKTKMASVWIKYCWKPFLKEMKFDKVTGNQKRDPFLFQGDEKWFKFRAFCAWCFRCTRVHESFLQVLARAHMHPRARRRVAPSSWRPKVSADVHKKTSRPLRANDHDVGEHASQEIWHASREKWGELFTARGSLTEERKAGELRHLPGLWGWINVWKRFDKWNRECTNNMAQSSDHWRMYLSMFGR